MSQPVQAKDMINNIKTDAESLVKDNIALAKAEIQPAAKHAGIGGGMFGAAGYFGMNAASLLFMAGAFAFSLIFTKALDWSLPAAFALGFVCMAVVLLILAGILALLGKAQISKVQPPKAAIAELKTTVDSLKLSLQRGQNTVTANTLARKEIKEVKKQAKDLDTL